MLHIIFHSPVRERKKKETRAFVKLLADYHCCMLYIQKELLGMNTVFL